MELEESIKGLEDIIKGDKDCMKAIVSQVNNPENDEDYMHFKKEIESIETIVNAYKKEKARADKLEKEYSKMLTKLDEYKEESIPRAVVEDEIKNLNNMKVEGETFTTAVNFAIKEFEEILTKGEK